MSDFTALIDAYIAAWNEPDDKRRRNLIAEVWTEPARYIDPMMQAEGHKGIDAMIQGVQEKFPGYRLRRTSEVDSHHNVIRFNWELGAEGDSAALAGGVDFGLIVGGRLQAITGFLDFAPTPSGQ